MTPLERARSALEAAGSHREGPHGWQCPAHDDQHASLSLHEGKDGRALLRCHTGCTPEQIVGALGLRMADLFPPKPGRAASGTIVATYDYTDEHGTLLYQTVRYLPKDFRQRRPDGHGGWIWNLKGARRVLYHLPKLLQAIQQGETVWLVEGEKDVHALEAHGVVATTAPMGAGKWRHDYTDMLAGADLTLVADSDEAGRRHTLDVAQRLHQAGCTLRIVQAAHGKDASDHLAAGLTLDQFQPVDPTQLAHTLGTTTHAGPTVADLIEALASYQYLDDPGHVWFTLAVAISGYAFNAEPLWGMLVGPPSSGKTETARALGNLAGYVDDLSVAGLLTFTKGKNPQPTGLLARIGKRGVVIIGDFSTVLAMSNRGNRDLLYGMLRRVYDGSADRDLAAGKLHWRGRLTILACCTPIIDDYSSHADALGPRWLYYRIQARSTHAKRAMGMAARTTNTDAQAHAAQLAEQLITTAVDRTRQVQVSERLHAVITDLAIVCCYARAAVPRSSYGRREITSMAIVEEPPRLTKQLQQLAHATLSLGADEAFAYQLCRRAALDSIPQVRRRVLDVLSDGKDHDVSSLARKVGAHRHVARFALEELAAAGVLSWPDAYDESDEGADRWASKTWQLDGPDANLILSVLAGHPWQEKYPMDLSISQNKKKVCSEGTSPATAEQPPIPPPAPPEPPTPPEHVPSGDGHLFGDDQTPKPNAGGPRVYRCSRCGHTTAPAFTDMTGLPHPDCGPPPGRFQPTTQED